MQLKLSEALFIQVACDIDYTLYLGWLTWLMVTSF